MPPESQELNEFYNTIATHAFQFNLHIRIYMVLSDRIKPARCHHVAYADWRDVFFVSFVVVCNLLFLPFVENIAIIALVTFLYLPSQDFMCIVDSAGMDRGGDLR